VPYIRQIDRAGLRPITEAIADHAMPFTDGELNYLITKLVKTYLRRLNVSYTAYNAAIGVLECAKLELYRRSVSPYEDLKCRDNGDV
jgi:hypothetical protein